MRHPGAGATAALRQCHYSRCYHAPRDREAPGAQRGRALLSLSSHATGDRRRWKTITVLPGVALVQLQAITETRLLPARTRLCIKFLRVRLVRRGLCASPRAVRLKVCAPMVAPRRGTAADPLDRLEEFRHGNDGLLQSP